MRERRLNGNDRCTNGHSYPSKDALPKGFLTDIKYPKPNTVYSGKPFAASMPFTFRWKKYSPKSSQFKKGKLGRFQEYNGYGWENTEWSEDQILTGMIP